ncbi:GNAT family N-acetyltransferase [Streptomyces oceani]|uniref:GCN5 family acetyltransferase n=1 Tax=Streptomyces oceani TaxID=1075402 RepID=A0A1E7JY57_9ACTN|nr:GNAT family N-acetyltransferase [Streptomyces oceani]OEU96582.1 GCN5 family acetyltransferase [Streptomyces oceani]
MRVRPARELEGERLREIERAAGHVFRDLGMETIAEDEPPSLAVLEEYRQAGRVRVAVGEEDQPVAYVLLLPVDDCTHVEQISVHPDVARRGIGRALLDEVAREANAAGVPALTLTTFQDVPWNAPYYERCGFRALEDHELTPGLRRVRRHEAELGLDRWPRLCMRRDLESAVGS